MKRHSIPGLATASLVAILLAAGCSGGEKSDVTALKLAHGLDTTHPVHKAMVFMAEKVQEKSQGRLRVDIYPSEQLGSERECIEQLQLGSLAMTKTSSGPMEAFVETYKVFGLPYLFRDSEHMKKVLDGPIGKELLLAGEAKRFRGLCYYDAGARSFYAKKPIHTPADLVGLKVRVMKSKLALDLMEVMGASATAIDWGELYTSLQQGVVDGAENNPPTFYTSNHYEVCPYYTLDEHSRLPDVLLISTTQWNRLSPEFQQTLQEAVDESVVYQRELWREMVQESLAQVEKAGVTIIRPDKQPFREVVKPLLATFEGTEVGDLAKRIQAVE